MDILDLDFDLNDRIDDIVSVRGDHNPDTSHETKIFTVRSSYAHAMFCIFNVATIAGGWKRKGYWILLCIRPAEDTHVKTAPNCKK